MEQVVTFLVPQVVEDCAQERISERNVVSMSPKTKRAKRRGKKGVSIDDGDDDAMLDEVIAEARKWLHEHLAELEAIWERGRSHICQMSGIWRVERAVCRKHLVGVASSVEVTWCCKCRSGHLPPGLRQEVCNGSRVIRPGGSKMRRWEELSYPCEELGCPQVQVEGVSVVEFAFLVGFFLSAERHCG